MNSIFLNFVLTVAVAEPGELSPPYAILSPPSEILDTCIFVVRGVYLNSSISMNFVLFYRKILKILFERTFKLKNKTKTMLILIKMLLKFYNFLHFHKQL